MNKLTTKLLVSVLTVAFALVALGTTTFAWFTLSETATVSQFEAQLTAGEGIEISLDGTTYYTTIPQTVIQAAIAAQKVVLKDLTSTNGVEIKKLNGDEAIFNGAAENVGDNSFIQFNLWVRSTKAATKVSVESVELIDEPSTWTADTTFKNAKGKTVAPNEALLRTALGLDEEDSIPVGNVYGAHTYHAADALRMSFTLWNAAGTVENEDSALVYENPESETNTVLGDTAIADGMVDYYLQKNGINLLSGGAPTLKQSNDLLKPGVQPEDEPEADPFLLATLGELSGAYAVQKMTVRLWVEGWDPDTFNSILDAKIFATIVFKSE